LEGALAILREPDPHIKAALAEQLAAECRSLPLRPRPPADATSANDAPSSSPLLPPDKPARLPLATTDPSKTGRRGRGGTVESRAKMIHALGHIESWAIDLGADVVARFAAAAGPISSPYPRSLAEDFCLVAADEARHFRLLEQRLREVHPEGKGYGCFPVHDGLWESAERTSRSLPARLAVEHCTHEARGLDVLPTTIARFRANGDDKTADLLEKVVYPEEVAHCAAGVRWLTWAWSRAAAGVGEKEALRRASAAAGRPVVWSSAVSAEEEEEKGDERAAEEEDDEEDDSASLPLGRPGGEEEEDWREDAAMHASPARWFRSLVARNFYGSLRPPFNEEARAKAGFTREWYVPEEEGEEAGAEGKAAAAGATAAGDDTRPPQQADNARPPLLEKLRLEEEERPVITTTTQ
jgi:uncharacterized ferritin-like protein (DUF455 family)